MGFGTGGSVNADVTIDSTGNVGIGTFTGSLGGKLAVVGPYVSFNSVGDGSDALL